MCLCPIFFALDRNSFPQHFDQTMVYSVAASRNRGETFTVSGQLYIIAKVIIKQKQCTVVKYSNFYLQLAASPREKCTTIQCLRVESCPTVQCPFACQERAKMMRHHEDTLLGSRTAQRHYPSHGLCAANWVFFLPAAKPLVIERPKVLWWWGDWIELCIS